jgi:hypothetical protein
MKRLMRVSFTIEVLDDAAYPYSEGTNCLDVIDDLIGAVSNYGKTAKRFKILTDRVCNAKQIFYKTKE